MSTKPSADKLLKPRSDAATQRAIDRWGKAPTDLSLLYFADLVSGGVSGREAYMRIRPASSEKAASSAAAVLMAHPTIRSRVRHTVGKLPPRELVRAAVPGALQRLYDIATGETGAPDSVQAKAIDSLLDRGGLPRSTDISVSAIAVATGAIDRVLSVAVAPDKRHTLDTERARWDRLLPTGEAPPT